MTAWVEVRRWNYGALTLSIRLRATPGLDLDGIVVILKGADVIKTAPLESGFRSPELAIEELTRIGESLIDG